MKTDSGSAVFDPTCDQGDLDLARRIVYQFLALAFSDPLSARWRRLGEPAFLSAVADAGDFLRSAASSFRCEPAPGEVPPERFDLRKLVERIADPSFDVHNEYQQVFGLMMPKRCPPYETEYCPQTFSVYRSQQLADVAGFYRAFGLEPSRDMPERHDHIALELEFMAWLIGKSEHACLAAPASEREERIEICRAAAERFFQQHIAWWMPAFAQALRRQSSEFYALLADALAGLIFIDRGLLGLPAPTELLTPHPTEGTDESSAACDDCCGT